MVLHVSTVANKTILEKTAADMPTFDDVGTIFWLANLIMDLTPHAARGSIALKSPVVMGISGGPWAKTTERKIFRLRPR
jgi:hypothetical protein